MADKTKAAMLSRQWDHLKQNQHTRAAAGGQSQCVTVISGATIYEIAGYQPEGVLLVLRTSFGVAQMQLGTPSHFWGNAGISRIFGRLIFNRCSDVSIRRNFALADFIQLLGSIPRCFNSFRTIRLSHAERVASPSSCMAATIASSSAGSTRKAICLLPLGIFMFDMCLTLGIIFVVSRNVHHVSDTCKARSPEVLPALTGPLRHA
ncbi:hypothetical protein [Atlantibacter hermannii]|uniref:hypothetical protein n=1 Tax=Atlantibacter hermannii TaxID=565 RepID=UPI00289AC2E7|nr:hypothetical protein [Atlantibacter hermannii]